MRGTRAFCATLARRALRSLWLRLVAFLLCMSAALAAGAGPQSETVSLDVLLGRAAAYLDDFAQQLSNVVCEERYVQDSTADLPSINVPTSRGRIAVMPPLPQSRHRLLKSDFLLVTLPAGWLPFRDTFEVDNSPVRDREARLTKLFLRPSPDTIVQAEQIRDESARYNIGNVLRTMNNPVLALPVVEPDNHPRFRFSLGKQDTGVGADVWIVEYKEMSGPTIVRGLQGQSLFAYGRLWIEAPTGRILKTELFIDQSAIRAQVTASFRFNDQLGIVVPIEMNELYMLANGSRVSGTATYGGVRRFNVTADEKIHPPEGTTIEK